jgi:L-asparaginase
MEKVDSRIFVILTGGTIAKQFDPRNELFNSKGFNNLFADHFFPTDQYDVINLLSIDSRSMTDIDRELIRSTISTFSKTHNKFIVVHGTDSMVATARFVGSFENTSVVFVGAFIPWCLLTSDAAMNIGFALGISELAAPGTYIAMNRTVFNPHNCQKNYELSKFEPIKEI